jgi:hypothetical protein
MIVGQSPQFVSAVPVGRVPSVDLRHNGLSLIAIYIEGYQ